MKIFVTDMWFFGLGIIESTYYFSGPWILVHKNKKCMRSDMKSINVIS